MDGFVRRLALLFALASCLAAAPPGKSEFVHAVEFPYYLYPRALWERELVWLKTIGVTTLSANDPAALARSRDSLATPSGARGALLWTDVEDALYPAGWSPDGATFLRKGAVGLSGDEHAATGALRRNAALLRNWTRLLASL